MIDKLIPEKVKNLEAYSPNLTPVPVRLDANESPFTPSKAVLDEMAAAVYSIDFNRYPDPYASELTEAFSEFFGLLTQNVVAGNGSDELISLIVSGLLNAGDTVTVAMPDFSMYSFYSYLAGANAVQFEKTDLFEIDFTKLLASVNESGSKMVLFSNPCNPTGWCAKREDIVSFIERANAIVVVDEAYMEFAPDSESVMDLVNKYDNLIVLKTMSKAFGSAALRLGFMIACEELCEAVRKIKSPYNVNTVSQVFGKIVLSHADEIAAKTDEIKANLAFLKSELGKIKTPRIKLIYGTSANFVFMEIESPESASVIKNVLMQKGVAIRCMGARLRITAGTREECEIFLAKFKEVLDEYRYGIA